MAGEWRNFMFKDAKSALYISSGILELDVKEILDIPPISAKDWRALSIGNTTEVAIEENF